MDIVQDRSPETIPGDAADRIPSTFDERESSETFSDTVPSCTISFENCRTEPEGIANGRSPVISLQHSIPPSCVETEKVGISPYRPKLHDSLCTDEGRKTGESHQVEECLSPGMALLRSDGESGFCESSAGGSGGIRSSEESQTNSSQEPSQETQEHRLHCTSTDVGSGIEDGGSRSILFHRTVSSFF